MELIRLSISLNEKVLIFSQYIPPLELLKDQIALAFAWEDGSEIMMIEGKIHQKVRQTVINGFNDPNSKIKVLLASTKCCSEGIHLTGASRVVLLDVVWNPSVERQAISRAYRLGQKKMVYTYHLMAAGTTEEEKYDRQVAKGRLAELVFLAYTVSGDRKGGGGCIPASFSAPFFDIATMPSFDIATMSTIVENGTTSQRKTIPRVAHKSSPCMNSVNDKVV